MDNTRIGAGKAVIEIPEKIFPVEKYNGIHDDLHARALVIESGLKAAIVSLELTSLPSYEIDILQDIVAGVTDIQKKNIWICVTHTFSAPHVRSEEAIKNPEIYLKNRLLCDAIEDAVTLAARHAAGSMVEAKIGFETGNCSVNVNRDIFTSNGWWLGSNNKGISDKKIPIIRFDTMTDQPIAILYSYDVQSSVMDGFLNSEGYYLISSDLTGRASGYVEEQYGSHVIALYCVGAAGDQAPVFKAKDAGAKASAKERGFRLMEALGVKLGEQVLLAAKRICCKQSGVFFDKRAYSFQSPGQQSPKNMKDLYPSREYNFIKAEQRNVSIEIMKLGNISVVGIQPEICSVTAMDIRKRSPIPHLMMMTMVNGGAKYMADSDSYDRMTYEAMNSFFGRGSAEMLTTEVIKHLKELNDA